MPPKKDQHLGKYVWELHQNFFRDQKFVNPRWFREWNELDPPEQSLYQHLGEAMLSYFRMAEGNDTLKEKLQATEKDLERLRSEYQKLYKGYGA